MAYNESDSWVKAINSNKYKSGNAWSSVQVQPVSIGTIGSKLTMPKVQIKDYFKPNIPLKTLDKKRAKSLSDVVLGGPMGTLELRNTFDKYDVPDTLRAVPVMNKLIGAALLVNDNTIDPIAKGKYNEAIVNNLSAVANDFDILANPVKSLLPVAGGGHEGDFLSSLGLGDTYRKTFQWDSGSFVLDMIGETLSDPLTYITFGLGKGTSTTADGVVNLTKENLAKSYGEQFVKTKLTDKEILNLVKEQGLQASKQTTAQNIITKTNDYLKELRTQLRTVKRSTKEYQELKELINKVYNATASDATNLINLNRAVAQVKNTKIFAQYETISRALNFVQKAQKAWGTAVYAAAPMVGAPMALLKEGSQVINHLRNKRITKLKDYDFETNLAAFSKAIKQMDKSDTTTWLASNVNKDWFKNLNNLLTGSSVTVEDLIPLYKKIYSSIEPGKRTSDMLRAKFVEQASNLILSKDKDSLVKEATKIFGKDIVSVQLKEAVDVLSDAFYNIAEFTNMLIETDSVAQEMIEYANNKAVRQQLKHVEYGSALQDLTDLINQYKFEPISDAYNNALTNYKNIAYGIDTVINNTQLTKDFNKAKRIHKLTSEIITNLNKTNLISNYDLVYIEAQINQIYNYTNTGLNIMTVFEDLFNKKYNLNNPEDLKLFYSNIFELQSLIKEWNMALTNNIPKHIDVDAARSFLQDLNKILDAQINRINKKDLVYLNQMFSSMDVYYSLNNLIKQSKYMNMAKQAGQSTKLNQLTEIIETLKSQGRMEEAKALNDLALDLGITKDNLRDVSDLYDIYRRSNGTNKHILNEIKDNCITNLTGLSNESGYKTAVDKYNKTAIDTYNSLLKRLSDPANAEAREEIITAFKQAAIHNKLVNAEQVAEDFNKTKKIKDLAVEIKTKLNETDLLNQYDLGYIETQLDQIFNYAGEEEELGIIPRLESVFMSDYNLDNPDELRLFYNNLSELQTLVKKWKATVANIKDTKVINVVPRTEQEIERQYAILKSIGQDVPSIDELRNIIKTSTDPDIVDNTKALLNNILYRTGHADINVEAVKSFLQDIDDIVNEQVGRITKENLDAISQVLTSTTTYYTLVMSAQNRLDMVMSRLSQLTGVTAENYNEISRPNSAFRKRLDNLLKVVNTKDEMGMSVTKSIKNMLAIIDGTNNLEITRANAVRVIESILDGHHVKVDNEVKNYLVNIVFDTLYGSKNTYISQTSAFALTQSTWNRMSNLLDHIERDFVESRLAMGEAEDVVNDLFLSFTDELHTAYENLFTSYYNKQRTLDLFGAEPTVIYSFVSNSDKFIRSANDLSAQYDDLIQYLLNNKVDPDNIIVAKDFITTMSGNQTKLVLDSLKQKVYDTVNTAGLTDNWGIEQTQNIVDTIKQAFREIAKVNADYQQLDLLGKVTANANNKQKVYSIVNYISKAQLEEVLSEYTIWNNIYDWTLANGNIAVKKVNDPDFLQRHFLTKESIDISSADATRFIETMRRQEHRSEIALKYIDKEVIEQRRTALIQMYSDELLPWRPKQVETYFKTASDLDILMWHYTTLQRRLSNNMSQTYHSILDNLSNGTKLISDKVKKQLTDEAVLSEILDDVTNNPITDDDLFDALFETDYTNDVDLIGDITKASLQKRYKNPDSLGVFKTTGEQYLKQDINAYERLDALNNVLRPLGVDTNRELKVERTDSLATILRSASPMQLKQYMRRNTNGVLFYVSDHPETVFNFTKKELESVGLAVTHPSTNKNITILVNLDDKDIGENLKYHLVTKHNAVQTNVSEILNKNIYYYNFDDMDLPIDLFTGDMIDQTVYNTFLEDSRIRRAIQKVCPNFFEMTSNNFFEKSAIRPNTIIVGDPNAYNILYDYSSKTFHKVNKSSGYKYANLYDSIIRGSTTAIKRVNGEHKWLDLFFNKDFSLKDTFAQAFEGASDEEIADVFKRNNWDAAVLKQNKKGEPVIYKIHIYNRKDLDLAMQQDAVILPHNVYRNAVLTINQHKLDTKLYKFYNSTIVATYKTMYLSTIGFLMRNAIDSGIFKNAQTTGGIGEILDNFKYEYRALKILEVYDNIIQEAQEYAIKRLNRPDKFNRGLIAEVLSHKSPEIQDIFKLTDAYINSAASAGLTKSMEEYLINYNLTHKGYQGFAISKWWDDNFLSMKPIQAIRDCNNTIEQTARYGLLLKLLEQGDTFAQAISKVIDTHFDYEIAGSGMKLLEQIFWFSTFPVNNIMYWLNQGLENNSIAKLQFDMMEQSYNNKYISYDDVKESDYLLYNMMTGNIIFKPLLGTDKQIVLKIGSSLFDFLSLLMDPYNEIKDRLNPFLSVLLGTDDLSQLNPAVTQVSIANRIAKGQSYLPSVYAKLYPKHSYPKRTYTWNYNNKRRVGPTKTYSPRLPSIKQMNYKYLTYRYYYNKGPNRHISVSNTTSVEPYWYLRSFYRTKYNKLKLKGALRRKGISTVNLHL